MTFPTIKLSDALYLNKLRSHKDSVIQGMLHPLFAYLQNHKITPTHLSIIGFIFHLAAIRYAFESPMYYSVFFILFLLFDALDGTYARSTKQTSEAGAYTDMLLDTLGATIFYIKALFYFPLWLSLSVLILYLLQTILMFVLGLNKTIGINRNACYFGIINQFTVGLYVDLIYLIFFCSFRLIYRKYITRE